MIEEAAATGTRLIFTLVWNVEEQEDADEVRELIAPYAGAGLPVSFVELYADLPDPTRAQRRGGADLAQAVQARPGLVRRARARTLDAAYVMNTRPDRPTPADEVLAGFAHLRLDNSELTPEQSAKEITTWLDARAN